MPNLLIAILLSSTVLTAQHSSWSHYRKVNRYKCPGPFDTLKRSQKIKIANKSYIHSGYRLEVQNPDSDNTIILGVLGSIKDTSEATKLNLKQALAWFAQKQVEWIIADGDLGSEENDLEDALGILAASKLPVLTLLGNSESRSTYARVFNRVGAYNLIDGVMVRQIIADDLELWVLPGYYDQEYKRQGAGCVYKPEDIDAMLTTIKPAGNLPIALVSHGPPRGSGELALDYISAKRNVGDPELNRLLQNANIPFGFFGHILEAGGRAVGSDFSSAIPAATMVTNLYINNGSIAAEAWKMNDGSTSKGMAMIVTIKGKQAMYETKQW
ncbi:MAG: metallophosphoesterase [Deltaproteobacteria bacterium]|nr:metallophosphoesterase [Deltaproteobacteria bacterium]